MASGEKREGDALQPPAKRALQPAAAAGNSTAGAQTASAAPHTEPAGGTRLQLAGSAALGAIKGGLAALAAFKVDFVHALTGTDDAFSKQHESRVPPGAKEAVEAAAASGARVVGSGHLTSDGKK